MAKTDYSKYTDEQLKSFIKNRILVERKSIAALIRYQDSLFDRIDIYLTKILKNIEELSLMSKSEKMYFVAADLVEIPKCPVTGVCCNYVNGFEYRTYASCKVAQNSKEVRQKSIDTNMQKFGVAYPTQSKKIKETMIENNIAKYSVKNPAMLDSVKEKSKQTNLERYGVEYSLQSKEVREKGVKTNIEKYGAANPFQSEEIKEKIKKTNLEKYGTEHASSSDIIKERIRDTSMEKYGVEHFLQSHDVRSKIIDTVQNKYGVDNVSKAESIKNKISNIRKFGQYNKLLKLKHIEPAFTEEEYNGTRVDDLHPNVYNWKCKNCGETFSEKYWFSGPNRIECQHCTPKGTKPERIIEEFLKSYNVEYIARSYKILNNGQQLDFYIPSKNLGIEVNGLYWHSTASTLDNSYHLDKLNVANSQGISLVNIFEDEIFHKRSAVFARLRQKLGLMKYSIRASKCEIREVEPGLAAKFLEKYHFQGNCQSAVRIGLFYRNRLVSIMTFGENRFTKESQWELLRFCSVFNFKIHGAYSKLMSNFVETYNPEKLVTYADRNWGNGNVYSTEFKVGETTKTFKLVGDSLGFTFTDLNHRYNRLKYQKHKLKELFNLTDEDMKQTADMILESKGIYRVYDCGNNKYELVCI